MVTRFLVGINRPTQCLNLHVSSILPLPKSYSDAFNDPNWQNDMSDEYNALIKNNTWTLVPRPTDTNIVRCIWLFRHKYLANGTLSHYKARLVANGSPQIRGINVDETFSPIVKPAKTVYMQQPLGFQVPTHPDYVCLLQRHGTDIAYLLLYVDDNVLTASFEILLQRIIASLHQEFFMADLGSLNYFLGISVTRDSSGMFLSQRNYATEILKRAYMGGCNPSRTPVDTEFKPGDDGDPVSDPTFYRSLEGSLQYITFTRLDISYSVQQICLYMHDPRESYFSALKRILWYVRDWAGCPITRRSTSGYCVFLGNNLLSWSSKHQLTLSRSSAEAEYRGVANVVADTCWLRNLLRELHTHLSSATLVYYDNVSAVYLSSNLVQHQRTKHIEIDIHFVWDLAGATTTKKGIEPY
ncbi:ribonuclease H-like domain-containing protein [Tanacetum coccineum]